MVGSPSSHRWRLPLRRTGAAPALPHVYLCVTPLYAWGKAPEDPARDTGAREPAPGTGPGNRSGRPAVSGAPVIAQRAPRHDEIPAADSGEGHDAGNERNDRRHEQDAVQAVGERGLGDRRDVLSGMRGELPAQLLDADRK